MSNVTFISRILLSTVALFSMANAPAYANPEATVTQGKLTGKQDGLVKAFLGIPYAAPPVEKLRWRAPQPAALWRGVRDATKFGDSCIQNLLPNGRPPWTPEYVVHGEVSEDCLSLNVWTPAKVGDRKPVLVWIHGGGFNEGSGSVPIYNGSALAGRDIVVVTVNYRLGALGFLAHPELSREASANGEVGANFGLQDQIAALKWIQGNIAAFGGDPGNVTIAGQSAGSMAVHSLVSSPLAKGLFGRAIAQSGLPGALPIPTLAQAEKVGLELSSVKGAKSLADMRALPAAAFISAAENPSAIRFGAIIDGKLLPASPAEILDARTFNDVPMMVGQTSDEGSAFPGYGAGDVASYKAYMARSFGDEAIRFEKLYPSATEAVRSKSVKDAARDRGLALIDNWATTRIVKGRTPVYVYYFSHPEPGEGSDKFGAFHSSEIPYVLSTLDMSPERNFTYLDRQISLTMSSYWVNFVRNGNPNSLGLPVWSPVSTTNVSLMEFGSKVASRDILSPAKLRAYRAYVAQGGTLSMF